MNPTDPTNPWIRSVFATPQVATPILRAHPMNPWIHSGFASSSRGHSYESCSSRESLDSQRFRQLLTWLGDDFDGLLAFEEAHKAKGDTAAQTQDYASALLLCVPQCSPMSPFSPGPASDWVAAV